MLFACKYCLIYHRGWHLAVMTRPFAKLLIVWMLSPCDGFGYVFKASQPSMCNGYNALNVYVVFSLRDDPIVRVGNVLTHLLQFASTYVYVILLNKVFDRKNEEEKTDLNFRLHYL